MTRPQPAGNDLAVGAVAAGVCGGGLLWAAGAVSAWLSGHRVPRGRPLAGYVALAHLGDPSVAWQAPAGPPTLYWTVTAVMVILAVLLALGAWTLWRWEPATRSQAGVREAMASRGEVRRATGTRGLLARSATLRRSLSRAHPADVGYRLGTARGVECWASVEDSMLLVGPPRSGKGLHVAIPMILDAPGAVVTTSTRPDNLAVTVEARAATGPVMVFDPQGLAWNLPAGMPRLRWPLARGCEGAQTAMIRAEALVADAGRSGMENGSFWRTQAVSVVRCLLHAAALDGRPASDLYRWSHSAGAAKEAVSVLAGHPAATPGWERALDAVIGTDGRTRDSVWAMVANAFAPLADPAVLEAATALAGEEFDPVAFLALRGSVYLLGTATGASATAPLVAALIEDLLDAARRLAARSPGQRLDPPLALVLDEAANYPLPSLPALMSEGGGSGVTTLAVLQSLAQARDRWGREAAQAIWDAAIVKLILGGSSNAEDLADLSRLIGETDTVEWSETRHGTGGDRSMSSSVRRRPILEPADLRRVAFGHGVLLLRSASPIMLRLQPWTDRPDGVMLAAARDRFEQSPGVGADDA